ncbi:hypothetical protein JCM5353_004910 [Sporobolomyces roseus]
MLDLLPPELVQSIVEYVGPPYWDVTTEPERFADLSSLSLVSKRLQSFAQPLLFAVLTLHATSHDKLLSQYSSNASTRCSTIGYTRAFLTEAAVNGDLQWDQLHVSACTAFNLETVFLPQLRELSLAYTRVVPQAIPQSRLPSLRHVAITNLRSAGGSIVTLINTSYHQLDSLSFDIKDLELLRPQIPHFSFHNLLLDIFIGSRGFRDMRAFHSNHRNVQHIRLHHHFDTPDKFDEEDLDRFIDFIASAPPSLALRTVYIARDLDPTRMQLIEESRNSKIRLIEACGRRNIEVIEEKVPEIATWDTFISPEFVRRMSLRK